MLMTVQDYQEWVSSIMLGLMDSPGYDPVTGMPGHVHGCDCWCNAKGPKRPEAEQQARDHRWPKVARVQQMFFKATMTEVTQMEMRILESLGLPEIKEVRRAVARGQFTGGGVWTWDRQKEVDLKKAISYFLRSFLGEPWNQMKGAKGAGSLIPLYTSWQLQAVAAGIDVMKSLLESANGRPEIIAMIHPDPDLLQFKAMQKAAGDRIVTELATKKLPEVKAKLEQMALDGAQSFAVAREMHKEFGEGAAWYWKRICRTENTLAVNMAYDQMCEANGVLYDEWVCGPGACIICTYFNGQIWHRSEGPVPVVDSHPNCGCVRVPTYTPRAERVSEKWTRPDPYRVPYTKAEIAAMVDKLKTRTTRDWSDRATLTGTITGTGPKPKPGIPQGVVSPGPLPKPKPITAPIPKPIGLPVEQPMIQPVVEVPQVIRPETPRPVEQPKPAEQPKPKPPKTPKPKPEKLVDFAQVRNRYLRSWTGGSNTPDSVHLKTAIFREFGGTIPVYNKHGYDIDEREVARLQKYVRKIYEDTQKALKKAGITEITLYRGITRYDDWGQVNIIRGNLESWADAQYSAKMDWGKNFGNVLMKENVKAEQIFMWCDGPGWNRSAVYGKGEREFIVMWKDWDG